MTKVGDKVEIDPDSLDAHAANVSIYARTEFLFGGVRCASIAGVLRALTVFECASQKRICGLWGQEAKQAGSRQNTERWWHGSRYERTASDYQKLLTSIFNARYQGDKSFRQSLRALGTQVICCVECPHVDPRATMLTQVEAEAQLSRLRMRALHDRTLQLSPRNRLRLVVMFE